MALQQFSKRTLSILLVNIRPVKDVQFYWRQCVYNISCACSRRYVGENARLFGMRQKEYRNYFKYKLREKSKLYQQDYDGVQYVRWLEAWIL
jgi:hypothetical protein